MEEDLYNTYNKELLKRKYTELLQINSKKIHSPIEKSGRDFSGYSEASIANGH